MAGNIGLIEQSWYDAMMIMMMMTIRFQYEERDDGASGEFGFLKSREFGVTHA